VNKPASSTITPGGINQPALQQSVINNKIVGPGGQNPNLPASPTITPGGINQPASPSVQPGGPVRIVGPGGQNPLSTAANKIVDSLVGREHSEPVMCIWDKLIKTYQVH
jgi:hypothetical protein